MDSEPDADEKKLLNGGFAVAATAEPDPKRMFVIQLACSAGGHSAYRNNRAQTR
jgi:hypothetical protein